MENSTRQSNSSDYTTSSNRTVLVIQIICYSGIIFVGTFGNIFIFFSLMHKKKRKLSDYFIMNLTITDLLCCVVSIPFDIMELTVRYWPLGIFMCKLVYPLQTILMAVSVGTLLFMAFERYRAIIHPLRPKIAGKYVVLTIFFLWMAAVIVVCPYMAVLQIEGSQCTENWPGPSHVKAFTTSVFVLLYVVPLSIITPAYIRVGIVLRQGGISMRNAFGTSVAGRRMVEIRSRRNIRVVKIFVGAVVAFAGCLLPFHIMWLWYDFGDAKYYKHYNDLLTFANILVYSNSAINPFIFGSLGRKFCSCSFIGRKRRPSRTAAHHNGILYSGRQPTERDLRERLVFNREASKTLTRKVRMNGNGLTDGDLKFHCLNNNELDYGMNGNSRQLRVTQSIMMTSSV